MKVKVKTARKQFRCESCPRPILPGETYTIAGKTRRHLDHGSAARPMTPMSVAERTLQHVIQHPPAYDQKVRMSTGHPHYPGRSAEAKFILDQFDHNYKPRALKKGVRGRILEAVRDVFTIFPAREISPELLFQLRTVYHRSKKLMDAEGGWR